MSYGGGTFQAAYLPTFFNPISGRYLECTGLFLDVFKKFQQMAPEKTLAAQFSRSGNTRAGNPRWGNVYQSNSKQGKFSRRGNFRCGTFLIIKCENQEAQIMFRIHAKSLQEAPD